MLSRCGRQYGPSDHSGRSPAAWSPVWFHEFGPPPVARIVRVAAWEADAALGDPGTRPFDLTGQPSKGWLLVWAQLVQPEPDRVVETASELLRVFGARLGPHLNNAVHAVAGGSIMRPSNRLGIHMALSRRASPREARPGRGHHMCLVGSTFQATRWLVERPHAHARIRHRYPQDADRSWMSPPAWTSVGEADCNQAAHGPRPNQALQPNRELALHDTSRSYAVMRCHPVHGRRTGSKLNFD